MADALHLERLAGGIAQWNAWARDNFKVDPDLSGADLAGRDLGEALLVDADLPGADLSRARLAKAKLARARLGGARLVGADLRGADLAGADIRGADLSKATGLSLAQLAKCNGDDTTLLPAQPGRPVSWTLSYSDAMVRGSATANAWRRERPDQVPAVDAEAFVGAALAQANLSKLRLAGQSFDGADLGEASLVDAVLTRASFRAARLRDANLSAAKADGATFDGAELAGAILERADLVGASFRGADLAGARLVDANIVGADLSGAKGLANDQVAHAIGDGTTRLPEGIERPLLWRTPGEALRAGREPFNAAMRVARSRRIVRPFDLGGQSLAGLDLSGYSFRGAILAGADLSDADVSGADLAGAKLAGADLASARGLTQAQIELADGDAATGLPSDLNTPLHWVGLRSAPLAHAMAPRWSSGALADHLGAPLARLAGGGLLLIIAEDGRWYRFTSEAELPPLDLRTARFALLGMREAWWRSFMPEPSCVVGQCLIEQGLYTGFVLTLRCDVSLRPGVLEIGEAPADLKQVDQARLDAWTASVPAHIAAEIGRPALDLMRQLELAMAELPRTEVPAERHYTLPIDAALVPAGFSGRLVRLHNLRVELEPKSWAAQGARAFSAGRKPSASLREMPPSPLTGQLLEHALDGALAAGRDGIGRPGRSARTVGTAAAARPVQHGGVMRQEHVEDVAETGVRRDLALAEHEAAASVICSVFAPPVVAPEASFDVQLILHEKAQLLRAAREATAHDPAARRRAFEALSIPIDRGQVVTCYLESADLAVDDPIATVVWQGEPTAARFAVAVLPGTHKARVGGTVLIAIDEVAIGEVSFEIAVGAQLARAAGPAAARAQAATAPPAALMAAPAGVAGAAATAASAGNAAHGLAPATTGGTHYARAFLSYARKDVAYASIFAAGLTANGIDLFVDVTSMEPGDEWRQKLLYAIAQADVFFLLWSETAAASPWVGMECEAACGRWQSARAGKGKPIRIRPIVLGEGLPKAPYCIGEFHADSRWRAMRLAGERPIFAS